MKIAFPTEAKPHQIAILYLYLTVSRDPSHIADFLHYANSLPVRKTLNLYKSFIQKEMQRVYETRTTIISVIKN